MKNKIKKINLLIWMMFASIFLISCNSKTKGDKNQPTISNEQAIIIFKNLIHIEPIYCLVTTIDNKECIICIANKAGVICKSKMTYYSYEPNFVYYKLTKFANAWRVDTQKPFVIHVDWGEPTCQFLNDIEIDTIGNKPYLYFLYTLRADGSGSSTLSLNFALFSLTNFQLTTLEYDCASIVLTDYPDSDKYELNRVSGDYTNLDKLTSKPDLLKFLENKARVSPYIKPITEHYTDSVLKSNHNAWAQINSATNQEPEMNGVDNSIENQPYASEAQNPNYKIRDLIKFDDSEWIIVSALNNGKTLESTNPFKDDALTEGKFITIYYKVKNISKKEVRFGSDTPILIDSQGREYNNYNEQVFYTPKETKILEFETLPPGITKEFYSIFEVADDAKNLKFQALSFIKNGDKILVNLGF
ncbi:MAG: hypothetical protein Q7U47_05195 [Paludibacter sp.]|nr:hypothetical protein [Paludibacter sp.]